MAASGPSSLLLTFKSKIEESVALVPDMAAGEKLKAVQFWNVVSERLQEIVNSSAADINALALKMDQGGLAPTSRDDHGCPAAAYEEPSAFGTTVYGEDYGTGESERRLQYAVTPPDAVGDRGFPPVSSDRPNRGHVSNGSTTSSTMAPLMTSLRVDGEGSAASRVSSETRCQTTTSRGAVQNSKSLNRDRPTRKNDSDWVPGVSKSVSKSKVPAGKCRSPSKAATTVGKGPTDEKDGAFFSESDGDVNGEARGNLPDTGRGLTLPEEETTDDPAAQNESESTHDPDVRPTEVIVIRTRNKPKKWKECDVCFKKLPSGSALTAHVWTHRKPFNCTECGACFSSKTNLTVHQRRHTGEKPYGCSTCSARFSTRGNLKRHAKTHTGDKPWECPQCGSRFTEKKTLAVHMRRHTGEKPYRCEVCQRCFAQKGILQSHLAMHLGQKAHLCEHCGKAFRQRSQLRLHTLRHQGVRKYACAACPAKFLTKGDLERHNRTHTGERPFVCDLCGKTFTRQQSLTEHTNRHYGLKPYQCKRCGKAFVEMSACYKHIKHHSKSGCTNEDIESGTKVNVREKIVDPKNGAATETTAEDSSTTAEDGPSDPTPIEILTGAQGY